MDDLREQELGARAKRLRRESGWHSRGLSDVSEAAIAPAFLPLHRALARTARGGRQWLCSGENGENVGEKWKC